jgi:hypothetical protein
MDKTNRAARRAPAAYLLPRLIMAAVLAIPAASVAQPTAPPGATRPQGPDRPRPPGAAVRAEPASRERLVELLRRAMPSWDQRVLTPPESQAWAPQVTPQRIAETLEDRELADSLGRAPDNSRVFRSASAVLRFSPERGELRYVNASRAVDFLSDIGRLPAAEEAQQLALRALASLGLPRAQFLEPKVATQMAGGGRAGSQTMEVREEVYRLVTVQRRLGDLTVLDSEARVAVNPRGQIHRLRINWPQFTLAPKVRLAEPSAVLDRATQVLLNHGTSARAQIRGTLAYVPKDPRDPMVVVPAVVFAVADPPTPFMIAVPVVDPAENDDD